MHKNYALLDTVLKPFLGLQQNKMYVCTTNFANV